MPASALSASALRTLRGGAALLVFAAACGEDGPTDPPDLEAAAIIEVVAGEFGGTVAAPADPQPAVRVVTVEGTPLPGVEVAWTPDEGDGTAAPHTATGADGIARPGWVLGERAGVQRITARLANGEERTIEAVAEPGPVSVIVAPARMLAEVAASTPAGLRFEDSFDNEVPLSRGTWSVASTDLASVDRSGVVSGLATGATELRVDVDGTTAAVPLEVRPLLRLAQISVGLENHACGLTAAGEAFCWGNNVEGQLGNGHRDPVDDAVPVSTAELFQSVSVGDRKACALSVSGRGFCWGWKGHSLLGDSSSGTALVPEPIALDMPLRAFEASLHHGQCAITMDDEAYCWGHNDFGQVGQGFRSATIHFPSPLDMDGPVRSIALSPFHGCALTEAGRAWCWGPGGRLGSNEELSSTYTPIQVAGTQEFVELARGFAGTCGLTENGRAFCWGGGAWEEIEPKVEFPRVPTEVSGFRFAHLASGNFSMCGILLTGEAGCWLGTGTMEPFQGVDATRFAMGFLLACALGADGAPYCWEDELAPTPERVFAALPTE